MIIVGVGINSIVSLCLTIIQNQLFLLYNKLMNKHLKNKINKKPVKSIAALHHELFGKLD